MQDRKQIPVTLQLLMQMKKGKGKRTVAESRE
jgi:hypothetical protein